MLNNQFFTEIADYIKQPGFNPDSLKNLKIGKTTPSDKKFIFYNWNIQQNDGANLYNGIIYNIESRKVIMLPDKYSETVLREDSVYINNDWPGGLYYKAIAPRKKTENYYVLFGWDKFSKQTARKSIDALTFVNDSVVSFGRKVFKTKTGKVQRVVIEYSASANFTLQYSKQKLELSGVRSSQRKVNDSIIIIDRLAPLNEGLTGIRWAYVPVGNIYDGYVFFRNTWTFVEGINARNPAIKSDKKKSKKKPQLDLFPAKN